VEMFVVAHVTGDLTSEVHVTPRQAYWLLT